MVIEPISFSALNALEPWMLWIGVAILAPFIVKLVLIHRTHEQIKAEAAKQHVRGGK